MLSFPEPPLTPFFSIQLVKPLITVRGADLPPFTPHAFRKTLVKWADTFYPTREAFKAFSQNIGHSRVVTSISAYCPVSIERQAELIKKRNWA